MTKWEAECWEIIKKLKTAEANGESYRLSLDQIKTLLGYDWTRILGAYRLGEYINEGGIL